MILKKSFAAIVLQLLFLGVYAQKLPKVQEVSLRAPANIKIDGKASEWNNGFQANNKSTGLLYTMSNDDNKLYLTIQTADIVTLYKINSVGLKLIINPTQKSDKGAISIVYPHYEKTNMPYINLNNKPIVDNSPESIRSADSVMRAINKRIGERAKLIKITGMANLDNFYIHL